ncbi:MAG: hypothetical protein JWM16_2206 [Verrucomicrobiales bacterium]|nr:hypothetical protein [Verrucomicrobiales bacterium]
MKETNKEWQRFLETRSEEAFRGLVEELLPLVYSTALRQVNGEAALAADITQVVFSDLAQKGDRLPANVYLAGWLYRHACFTATKVLRSETRRKAREREAVRMHIEEASSEPEWEQIAPLLEEGMNSLGATDRDALLLRYFEGRDLRSVGKALGSSEDAAQKRISRAVEKLRKFFLGKGVTVSGTALTALLVAHSSGAVPIGLGALIAGSAISGAAVATSGVSVSTATWIFMGKMKAITIGTAVAVGVTTFVLLQQKTIRRLRAENGDLEAKLEQASAATKPVVATGFSATELARLQNDRSELLRLRAENSKLRSQQGTRSQSVVLRASEAAKPPAAARANFISSQTWANVGFGTPQQSLQTGFWAARNGDIEKFKQSIVLTEGAKQIMMNLLAQLPGNARKEGYGFEEAIMLAMMSQDRNVGYKGYQILTEETPAENEIVLGVQMEMNSGKAEQKLMRFQRFGTEWKQFMDAEYFRKR